MNQNWDITQDEQGTIYLANTGGIIAFDGVRWTTFQLPGNPIVRCVTYANGRLYAGGYGEFGYFEVDQARSFTAGKVSFNSVAPAYTSLSDRLKKTRPMTEEIWQISVLDKDRVFFQSFGKLFLAEGEQVNSIAAPGILMFGSVDSANFVLPVNDRGLFKWTPTSTFALIPGSEALSNRLVTGLVHLPASTLIATRQGGVFQLSGGILSAWNPYAIEGMADWQINRLLQLRDGSLVVGTIQRGIFILSPQGKLLQHLYRGNGLQNNTILSLFEDQTGNLWIGMDRGVDLLVRSEPIRYFTGENQSLGAVYAAAHTDDAFYLGTNQGLFYRPLNDLNASFTLVPGTEGQVWELQFAGEELLCGHNDGTFVVKGTTARKISTYSGGWQTIPVPGDPTTFIQATYTGLIRLKKNGKNWTTDYLPDFVEPIRYLAWTGDHELLAVHNARGVFRVQLTEDLQSYVSIDTLTNQKLSLASLAFNEEAWLLQAATKPLALRKDTLVPVEAIQGKPVKAGAIYLNGRPGSGDWFEVENDRVSWYVNGRLKRVLPIRMPALQPTIVPWFNETYLFCLDDGYALLYPETKQPEWPPLTVQAAYFNTTQWVELSPDLGEEPIILPYRHNRLRFRFSQPVFDRPLKFSYRLPGVLHDWSEWSDQSEREFTNLPEGNYRLEVRGNWVDEISVISFSIQPPWFRSWPAYLGYFLAVIGLLVGLSFWHQRRLSRQERLLEIKRKRELQRQKILERYDRLEEESHRKSKELANSTLSLAQKKEMLLTLKEELADTRKKYGTSLPGKAYQKLVHLIDHHLGNEEDWAIFEAHFEQVHAAFLKRLRKKHHELTAGDLKLAAYLRMNLSSKEIAPLLHISIRGVENKRYRLRKKLGLTADDNINTYLMEF